MRILKVKYEKSKLRPVHTSPPLDCQQRTVSCGCLMSRLSLESTSWNTVVSDEFTFCLYNFRGYQRGRSWYKENPNNYRKRHRHWMTGPFGAWIYVARLVALAFPSVKYNQSVYLEMIKVPHTSSRKPYHYPPCGRLGFRKIRCCCLKQLVG